MAQVPPLVDPALVVAIRNQMRWNDLHEGQEESLVHTLLDYDDLREGTLVVALGRTEKMLWQVRRKQRRAPDVLAKVYNQRNEARAGRDAARAQLMVAEAEITKAEARHKRRLERIQQLVGREKALERRLRGERGDGRERRQILAQKAGIFTPGVSVLGVCDRVDEEEEEMGRRSRGAG